MSIQVFLGQYFFLFGLVWLLDVDPQPSMRLSCVCPERKGVYKSIVSVLGWCLKKNLNVAVGWLVDFEFTSQRLVLLLVG